jgi:hypothetical protein
MKHLIALAAFCVTLACAPSARAAIILSVSPSPVSVAPGGSFQLNVTLSGFPDIVGFQFDVFYPDFLELDTVTEGGFFAANGVTFSPGAPGVGTVSGVSDVLISPGVPDPDVLMFLDFTATAPGTGAVSLDNIILLDSSFTETAVDQNNAAAVTSAANPVPEPSTWLLMLMGGALLLAIRALPSTTSRICPAASSQSLLDQE